MTDSREYPTRPICGVGVVVKKDDAVLLIQRGRAPRLGEWTVPGGAVELGESLRAAARREIREECGIEIELGEILDAFEWLWRGVEGGEETEKGGGATAVCLVVWVRGRGEKKKILFIFFFLFLSPNRPAQQPFK